MKRCYQCYNMFDPGNAEVGICRVCGLPLCPECAPDRICASADCEDRANLFDEIDSNKELIEKLTIKYDTLKRAVIEFLDATDRWQSSVHGSFCIACGSRKSRKHVNCPLEELDRLVDG